MDLQKDSSQVQAFKNSSQALRAPLSEDLYSFRETLVQLFPLLQAQPHWYCSISFERKASKTYTANLKQTQMSSDVHLGVIFRIYNGYTLFEEATDDLSPSHLKTLLSAFIQRVSKLELETSPTLPKRFYSAPTWEQRCSHPLDREILEQIPNGVTRRTPVHFGIRYEQDPTQVSAQATFEVLKNTLQRCQKEASRQNFALENLSYIMARQSIAIEESIFIDSETQMSQTLYRLSLSVSVLSGSDRTALRIGGLGGLETLQLKDAQISELIHDLKKLKSAQRIQPGKYRVLLGPALTGVLAHEAFGHSQEGDTCARGRSKAWELFQSGERVGNEHATILNNPAIYRNGTDSYGAWGSYFFDEEGWLAQEQVLLDQGRLLAPMTDLTSAIRLGVPRTANGKREKWANGIYTRQTNTYFSAGTKTLPELMQQLGDGFMALHAAGGMEDPKGMGIQVGIAYLYEVKEGKLTGQIFKGPAGGDLQMTGYTPDILFSILDKSKIEFQSSSPDRAQHPTNDVGGCGKYHKEFVYAGCGGPYLLVDQVVLG